MNDYRAEEEALEIEAYDNLIKIFDIFMKENKALFNIDNSDNNYDLLWDEIRNPVLDILESRK